MDDPVAHYFLVHSASKDRAIRHVKQYLSGNQLISYATFVIQPEEVYNGSHPLFEPTLAHGLAANAAFARRMLAHLKEEGVTSLEQLPDLQQGYVTKVLHTLTHLLDGFIGIDSTFYNLIEDSHRVSEELTTSIHAIPVSYWLVSVRAGKLETSLLHRVN